VRKPKILILDEATSAIDVRGEKIVQAALDKVAKNRTTITIAHRLSTIKKADRIIVLKKGKVVETGTHDSLLENPEGVYSGLVLAQKLNLGDTAADDDSEDSDHKLDTVMSRVRSGAQSATEEGSEKKKTAVEAHRTFFASFGRLLLEQRSQWLFFALTVFFAACVGGMI